MIDTQLFKAIEDRVGYTRVTAVLNPFSGYGQVPKAVLEAAQDRGSRTHTAIEAYLDGFENAPVADDIKGYVDSFKKWWITDEYPHGRKVIETEKRLYDDRLMITGKFDLIYRNGEGTNVLVDFKTSAKVNPIWQAQGSAYVHLAQVNGYELGRQFEFIKLDKSGEKPKVYTYDQGIAEFMDYLLAYERWFIKMPAPDQLLEDL